MAQYLSCAETAKLVRAALKESFPGVKFSVKSSVYSGGASINIKYTDGPTYEQVKAVAGMFEGAYFDGMTDYKGSNYGSLDGNEVRFGNGEDERGDQLRRSRNDSSAGCGVHEGPRGYGPRSEGERRGPGIR